MQITIKLHGALKQFSESATIEVDTLSQAISWLLRAFKGIRNVLRNGVFQLGLDNGKATKLFSSYCSLQVPLFDGAVVHLYPVEGIAAKKALAIGAIIVGVALMATGVFAAAGGAMAATAAASMSATMALGTIGMTAASAIGLGFGLASMGASMLMASKIPSGDLSAADTADNRQSTLFNAASNRVAKGVALPVCYGRFLCGSNIVSQSLVTAEAL